MPSDDASEPSWLTVPELARHLGRSESTVRHWRKVYRDALRSSQGPHGYALYAVAQFRMIAALAEQRRAPRDIRAALAGDQPAPTDFERTVLARLDAIERAIRDLAERLPAREPAP